jgi:uncharacterized protein YciI
MPVQPFQRLTVVRLLSHPQPPPDGPEDDAIQAAHVAYLRGLVEEGTILVNGPVRRIDDPRIRGMSLYTLGPDDARRIASADPAVRAGWFEIAVDEWVFPAVPRTIGDRADLEVDVPEPPRQSGD